ncbi:MBL fold metallo-hydrolase [Schlesneria paludicola]|uniref:MBL fold metallo-hydrolase n=1 Tax=Schlesneria paludicola TaxID=360056 RepID=UPI00029B5458|nr:MBL fold metallo-hydrolase [Schlesneria paludicola]
MKITFLGAAGEVTGSQHLIETDSHRILLDCGLFQGHRTESRLKNEHFYCDPKSIDGVILSHAHADHCGNLPGLYKAGYRGPIFCTPATADVADVMLHDSAHIQEEDAKYLNRKHPPGTPSIKPLYDDGHVTAVVKNFETVPYADWHQLSKDFRLRFQDAGHILGSAITEMEIRDKGDWKRVVFTGDLGRRDTPLLRDPQRVEGCDVLITESTYGNRIHPPADDIKVQLKSILKRAAARGGRVIIPAFSLGRTQTFVYFLNQLSNAGELPSIPVYVDSPLSKEITSVYRNHNASLDVEFHRIMQSDKDPFSFPGLRYIANQSESMQLNHRKGAFVVIAASGMCEAGRVVHHLLHGISDPNNIVVLIGYQAENTLGRRIHDQAPMVRILDHQVELRAEVESLEGLSAHADAEDFKWWFEGLAADRGVGRAFIVHGEQDQRLALSQLLDHVCDEPPTLPKYRESFEV